MKTSLLFTILSFFFFLSIAQAAPLHKRQAMSGKATYYEVGLGSCGETNTDSEMVCALSIDLMGSHAGSSYCGRFITINSGSKSVKVKVVDTCPGCGREDIDLSPSAFKKLGKLEQGVLPITWSL